MSNDDAKERWVEALEACKKDDAPVETLRAVATVYLHGDEGLGVGVDKKEVRRLLDKCVAQGSEESALDIALLFSENTTAKMEALKRFKASAKSKSVASRASAAIANQFAIDGDLGRARSEYKQTRLLGLDVSKQIVQLTLAMVRAKHVEAIKLMDDV